MDRYYRVSVVVKVEDDQPDSFENEENIVAAAVEVATAMFAEESSEIEVEEILD